MSMMLTLLAHMPLISPSSNQSINQEINIREKNKTKTFLGKFDKVRKGFGKLPSKANS